MDERRVIRETRSVCPECFKDIPARVIVDRGKVYLRKECPDHGPFELLVSGHPRYYGDLDKLYFSIMDPDIRQRDFIVHLTDKCNLSCPICLAGANKGAAGEYPAEALREFLKKRRNNKIGLMGAEPTMREDLADIIRIVRRSGNIASLHTNGIKLADPEYCRELVKAGLNEVHLQFDGLDDGVYRNLRGSDLLYLKNKALLNLESLGVASDLVVTVVRGVNDLRLHEMLDLAARTGCVREVFFLGCRYLGNARGLPVENCVMPDELIDMLESLTRGFIKRSGVYNFQLLYFCLLSIFSVRKCFYIQHYMLVRTPNGCRPVEEYLNLAAAAGIVERYARLRSKNRLWASVSTLALLCAKLFKPSSLVLIPGLMSYVLPFIAGFNLGFLSRKIILVGFISACDAYSYDSRVAANCGKGAVSTRGGVDECGARDNIARDSILAGAQK